MRRNNATEGETMITELFLTEGHSTATSVARLVNSMGCRIAHVDACLKAGLTGGFIASDHQGTVAQWYRHWLGPIACEAPFQKGTRVAVEPR